MATHVGIGFSDQVDIITAAKEAAFEAKSENEQNIIDFAIIFATSQYSLQHTVPYINNILNTTNTFGASTSGIIFADSVTTRGIGVLAVTSDTIKFGLSHVHNIPSKDPRQAGNLLAQEALKKYGQGLRSAFLYFFDGYLQENSSCLRGLQDILGNAFTIVGAGSCDDFRFKNSYQSHGEQVFQHSATGGIFGGQTTIAVGGRHGWKPLGKPRKITESQGNTIKTIDGKKASYIYEDYFGKEAERLQLSQFDQIAILYPLGLFIDRTNEYLLRNVVKILPDGCIQCHGEVPQGAEVHIMIGNKESCKNAAIEAAYEAKKNLQGENPEFIIILESMARQKLLGRKAHQEIQEIRSILGPAIPIIGMYTYGEIYPFQDTKNMKKIHMQNESIVILAIR